MRKQIVTTLILGMVFSISSNAQMSKGISELNDRHSKKITAVVDIKPMIKGIIENYEVKANDEYSGLIDYPYYDDEDSNGKKVRVYEKYGSGSPVFVEDNTDVIFVGLQKLVKISHSKLCSIKADLSVGEKEFVITTANFAQTLTKVTLDKKLSKEEATGCLKQLLKQTRNGMLDIEFEYTPVLLQLKDDYTQITNDQDLEINDSSLDKEIQDRASSFENNQVQILED